MAPLDAGLAPQRPDAVDDEGLDPDRDPSAGEGGEVGEGAGSWTHGDPVADAAATPAGPPRFA